MSQLVGANDIINIVSRSKLMPCNDIIINHCRLPFQYSGEKVG